MRRLLSTSEVWTLVCAGRHAVLPALGVPSKLSAGCVRTQPSTPDTDT